MRGLTERIIGAAMQVDRAALGYLGVLCVSAVNRS